MTRPDQEIIKKNFPDWTKCDSIFFNSDQDKQHILTPDQI